MKTLILLLAIVSIQAEAKINYARGEWGSGGGNALVCFKNVTIGNGDQVTNVINEVRKNNNTIPDQFLQYIDSIELFDLYEAKKRRGLDSKKPEILVIRDDEKIYEYFDRLGKRFEKNVYVMKNFIEVGKELIPDTNLIFHESAVKYQNDLGSVTLPGPNCLISTMAAQVNFNDYFEVHIDERLFNHPKHSKQSKATLVLHELIYALGRKHMNHKDSGATRNVVRYFISYHESFTEGVVAKALNDLGFFKKDSDTPEIMAKYHYSKIMSTIALSLEVSNDFILREFKNRYNWTETAELIDEVQNQLITEGLGDPTVVSADYFGLKEMIELGLRKTSNKNTWFAFRSRLDQILNSLKVLAEVEIAYAKQDILDELNQNSQITPEDLKNAIGHMDIFLGEYLFIEDLFYFKDIKEERDTYKEVMDTIYKNFVHYTTCRAPLPVPVPGDGNVQPVPPTESESCFTPLLLNNIIPKQ